MLTISPWIQPMYIASIGEFEIQMVLGSRKVKLTYDDMNIKSDNECKALGIFRKNIFCLAILINHWPSVLWWLLLMGFC